MKKLLLLTMVGLSTASAFAQSQNSVVFTKRVNTPAGVEDPTIRPIARQRANQGANKGTAGAGEWFSYVNIMYNAQSSKGYINAVAPDSNIKVTYSNATSNIYAHGFGQSFDPTDSVFKAYTYIQTEAGAIVDNNACPSFAVYSGNAYTIDSIAFPFKYYRNDATATTDSLIINVYRASRSTTGQTQGISTCFFTDGDGGVSPLINPTTGNIDSPVAIGADRQEIKVALDAAFFADTTTGGLSKFTTNGLKLPSVMSLNANQVVVIYAYVKLQKTYPLNTPNTAANYGLYRTYDLAGAGAPLAQSGSSVYTSLVTTNQTTYHGLSATDPNGFRVSGHNISIPAVAFTSGTMIDFDVKVTCASCVPSSVRNVATNVFAVTAFPNPAANELTVKFNQKTAAVATVSITNTVGQVLSTQNLGTVTGTSAAKFSTSDLANGLYFVVVESNGQRTTERFVVAH